MTAKISILMGSYNARKTIDAAIKSILNQSFTDWEFIICDDGSNDQSYELIQKYKDDKRFIILKNEKNLGLAFTLNHCLKYATGKYIARQDADDISLPERLQKQFDYLETHSEVDVLGTQADLIDDQGQVWGELNYPLKPIQKDWIVKSSIIHATILAKRNLIMSMEGYNTKALRVEDYELWFRLLEKKYVFETLPEKLYQVHWTLNDYGRKKYIDRIREAKCRFKGYQRISAPLFAYLYVIKPLILGLLPGQLLKCLHETHFKKTNPA